MTYLGKFLLELRTCNIHVHVLSLWSNQFCTVGSWSSRIPVPLAHEFTSSQAWFKHWLACNTGVISPVIFLVSPLTFASLNKVNHYSLSLLLFAYLFDWTVYWYASWVFGFRCRSLHHHILLGKHAVIIPTELHV